jgi:hypothetical protein
MKGLLDFFAGDTPLLHPCLDVGVEVSICEFHDLPPHRPITRTILSCCYGPVNLARFSQGSVTCSPVRLRRGINACLLPTCPMDRWRNGPEARRRPRRALEAPGYVRFKPLRGCRNAVFSLSGAKTCPPSRSRACPRYGTRAPGHSCPRLCRNRPVAPGPGRRTETSGSACPPGG